MHPEHRLTFAGYGFVHIAESVLPHPLPLCVAEFDRCIRDARALKLDVDNAPIGATEIRKVGDAWRGSVILRAIIETEQLGAMAAALMKWPATYVWSDSLYSKPPHSGVQSVLAFHQDWQYWSSVLTSADEAVTAVVPLYHARRESGGVGFMLRTSEVYPVVEPGHVTFHHPLIFHGSRENETDEPRRSMSIHFTSRADLGRLKTFGA